LLANGQDVVGLDNFSSGHASNLAHVKAKVGSAFNRFRLIEDDIRNPDACREAMAGVDVVLHQAAIASVPLSMEQPLLVHDVNVTGFLTLLEAARAVGVRRFVYASSSAVYGDSENFPQIEDRIGQPLSPYGATKRINEIYGHLYSSVFGLECVGLRYFNVYGPRQDPEGAYSAVLPRWIASMVADEQVTIHGSSAISRDFCFIDDVVQANIRAATTSRAVAGQVFNIATGTEVSLAELFEAIRETVNATGGDYRREPILGPARQGDIVKSTADIAHARRGLEFSPEYRLNEGIMPTLAYYRSPQGAK
jgi:UDP-N-acetylglucosamine 4-epimerase